MATAKKGDFVELEYTGRIKDENIVFDTTDKAKAEELGLNTDVAPVKLCLGEGMMMEGLEKELEGKEIGKELKIELSPEQAFGKKDAKLVKMVPMSAFKKNNIVPEPGLQINMDGLIGIVKTAAGGRCLVDFNHPLSGKDLEYDVKMLRVLDDESEKLRVYMQMRQGIKDPKISIKNGIAEVEAVAEVPKELNETYSKEVNRLIPSIKEVKFVVPKDKKASESKKE